MYSIPLFADLDACRMQEAASQLEALPSRGIACNNWANDYPYAPQAEFRIAHNGEAIFIRFDVKENFKTSSCPSVFFIFFFRSLLSPHHTFVCIGLPCFAAVCAVLVHARGCAPGFSLCSTCRRRYSPSGSVTPVRR